MQTMIKNDVLEMKSSSRGKDGRLFIKGATLQSCSRDCWVLMGFVVVGGVTAGPVGERRGEGLSDGAGGVLRSRGNGKSASNAC